MLEKPEKLTNLGSDNPFRIQEKIVHLGKVRMSNETQPIDNMGDMTVLPDGFEINDYLVIASPLDPNFGSELMNRTSSDGRSLGLLVGQMIDLDGRHFCEVQVKGVGGSPKTTGVQFQNLIPADTELFALTKTPGLQGVKKRERQYPLRYSFEEIMWIAGNYGFSDPIEVVKYDSDISDLLAKQGLRTRKLLYANEFGEGVLLSTPKGVSRIIKSDNIPKHDGLEYSVYSNHELKENASGLGIPYMPGLEVWAMRSRYRLRDVANYPFISANQELFHSTRNEKLGRNGMPDDKPFHIRLKKNLNFDNDQLEQARGDFCFLAREIIDRSKLDEDPRFIKLGEEFDAVDLSNKEKSQDFWNAYLQVFGKILGEQVGIMYSAGAFSKDGMLNNQNVTLLGEIVDHDITYIDENLKRDPISVIRQISYTLRSFREMIVQLYALDLINEDADVSTYLDKYIKGFLKKLNHDDMLAVKDMLATFLDEREISIENYLSYQTILDGISQVEDTGKSDFLVRIKEAMKQKIVYTFIPELEKYPIKDSVFALSDDILGYNFLRYFMTKSLGLMVSTDN